jgi:L-glutamine-phosphate cytidylyltransferase
MKAFLMAAGMGRRISIQTNRPKCLLTIGTTSLIRNTVSMLLSNNIEVNIVLGYKNEMVKRELQDLKVNYYLNPFYEVSNSIASLWFAKEALDGSEDIIVGNADVFWEQDILDLLLAEESPVVMLADTSRTKVGDYFFRCVNNKIVDYGKQLKQEERSCEYVGIAKIARSFIPEFRKKLDFLVSNGNYNFWWEDTLYSMILEHDILIRDVNNHFWSEIDIIQDYHRILEYVKTKSDIPSKPPLGAKLLT